MEKETFITLSIHTYGKAVILKQILEGHDIEVRLENVNLKEMTLSPGVRVRIREKDLPLALKITESAENYSPALCEMKMAGMGGNILIPVDFSDYSVMACKVGFEFAKQLELHPIILNTFITPYFDGNLPLTTDFGADLHDANFRNAVEEDAKVKMLGFVRALEQMISVGRLPKIRFSTMIREGIPEEVILDYAKTSSPKLIVMATRGKDKKEKELIGSVTAEVLDSCRVPVFTVPEGFSLPSVESLGKVAFFCNLNRQDLLSIDTFVRLFGRKPFDVELIPVAYDASNKVKMGALRQYCENHYPESNFFENQIGEKNFRADVEKLFTEKGMQLLVVPNKKKSIFSRLFNPGMAHKILFERDVPMLALPV